MAQFQRHFVQELTKPLIVRQCGDLGFSGDNNSDVISVDLYTDGVAYSGGGTCAGACICPDGSTVALSGSVSGKTASVTLTEDCFAITGQIGIAIRVTTGTTKTTVLKAIYNVDRFSTDNPVDPGSRISLDVGDLINRIDTAVESIPASADQLKAAMATNFSNTTPYPAGAYVYYNGTLYRFTTAHAAGSWTGTDVAQVALGNDADSLSNAIYGERIADYHYKYFIAYGSPYAWSTANNVYSYILPVNPGDVVKFKSNSVSGCRYALLKSLTGAGTGSVPDFATGYTQSNATATNTNYTITAPNDAHYLYFIASDGTNNKLPTELYINDYDVLGGVVGNVNALYDKSSDIRPVFHVGSGQTFTTIKGITEYITEKNIQNAVVYVAPGTYDLVNEYGQSYLDSLSVSGNVYVGPRLGNNTIYVFDEGAYIKFLYSGTNTAVAEYFSAFNIVGNCVIENANVEVANARYCVHEDLPAGSVTPVPYIIKYLNCVMKHNGNTIGTYTGTVCIGAGTMPNSLSIVEGGEYTCGTQFPWAISYHNFSKNTYGDKPSRVVLKNVWMNNGLRLGQQSDSVVTVEVSGCRMQNGFAAYDPKYFTVTEWDNIIGIPDEPYAYWANILVDTASGLYSYDTAGKNSLIIKATTGDIINIRKTNTGNAWYSFVGDDEIIVSKLATVIDEAKNTPFSANTKLTVPSGCTYVMLYDVNHVIVSATLNETLDLLTNTEIDGQWKADGDLFSIEPSSGYMSESYQPSFPDGWNQTINKRVVALNHDDLAPEDWEYVRKVYNKYGFKANFSIIVSPFANAEEQAKKTKAIKEMVADGHQIGLHGFFGTSFWWMNKLWDMAPELGQTFAPLLPELQAAYNTEKFSKKFNASSTFADIGYFNPGTSDTIGNISGINFKIMSYKYALAFGSDTYTGLDLTGVSRTWTYLTWLEHWYNVLIDDSLGYSNNSDDVNGYFFRNYEVPSGTAQTAAAYKAYYPDAAHLLSGKIVFFDDTSNPHYSDDSYQKVGRFKQGLFKGHASCCNYEVEDIMIKIAKAYCKHYFGFDALTAFDRHGVKYVELYYVGDDKMSLYENREYTVVAGEFGRFYNTKDGKFETQQDILLRNGITCSTHFTPINSFITGQIGIYQGMWENRYPYYWSTAGFGNKFEYLDLIGSESGWKNESYTANQVLAYFNGQDDFIRYAYEKAGETISNGTNTAYMHKFFRIAIDTIRSTVGTGMIPTLSLDTITLNASNNMAVELLCQWCLKNGYEIVPLETARRIAISTSPDPKNNYFPNPAFRQKLLTDFGGESDSPYAYLPDGFALNYDPGITKTTYGISVENKAMTISNSTGSTVAMETHVYGLAPGTYQISLTGKKSAGNGISVSVFALKNSDPNVYRPVYATEQQIFPVWTKLFEQTDYEKATGEIVIPEKVFETFNPDDYKGAITKGYGNNVSNLMILISASNGTVGTLKEPIIKAV